MSEGYFKAKDLMKIADAPPPDKPPLEVGEYCKLNSGSPDLIIIAIEGDKIIVETEFGEEYEFFRTSLRRTVPITIH